MSDSSPLLSTAQWTADDSFPILELTIGGL
ncbi:MAG: hypothetical protein JWQ31_4429, partial [Mycobacterium sp.]|nr:hypothetical protein [Mycobacterium sp.]